MIRHQIACICAATFVISGCGSGDSRLPSKDNSAGGIISYGALVNIRASDVPGFVPTRYLHARVTKTGPFGTAVERCTGGKNRQSHIVGAASQSFADVKREQSSRNGLPIYDVQSGTYVLESNEAAVRAVMMAISTKGEECLKKNLIKNNPIIVQRNAKINRLLEKSSSTTGRSASEDTEIEGPALTNIKISSIMWRVQKTPVYVLRTIAHFADARTPISATSYYQDKFIFTVARNVIVLNTVGSPLPFSEVLAQRLISVLVMRASSRTAVQYATAEKVR